MGVGWVAPLIARPLRTHRSRLRPLAARDRAFYTALYGSARVMAQVGDALPAAVADAAFDRVLAPAPSSATVAGCAYWIIEHAGLDSGCVALVADPAVPDALEFGILLSPHAQGRGIVPAVAAAVFAIAFEEPGLAAIVARHRAGHRAAAAHLARLGFVPAVRLSPEVGVDHWRLDRDRWQARARPRIPSGERLS